MHFAGNGGGSKKTKGGNRVRIPPVSGKFQYWAWGGKYFQVENLGMGKKPFVFLVLWRPVFSRWLL